MGLSTLTADQLAAALDVIRASRTRQERRLRRISTNPEGDDVLTLKVAAGSAVPEASATDLQIIT